MSTPADNGLAPSDKDGFHWSFDEMKSLFFKPRGSTDRGDSTASFHWSLSSAFDIFRSKLSSRGESQLADTEGGGAKKVRYDMEADRESRRENQREERRRSGEPKKPKKSEKEKDRRNNVNNLFYHLGELLGMQSGTKSKTEILANAKNYLDAQEQQQAADLLSGDEVLGDLRLSDDL